MVTVSHLAKKYIDETPFLHEGLGKRLLNYAAVAEMLRPKIERELGAQVKTYAIVMALRRYADEIVRKHETSEIIAVFGEDVELGMKSGLCVLHARKSKTLFAILKSIYDIMDYERGDILNMIHGNLTVTIVINEKHARKVMSLLEREDVLQVEHNLSQISLLFPEKVRYTPGILYFMTKEFFWNNVNLIETVSAVTELNYVVKKKDALRAYASIEGLIEKARKSKRKHA